PIGSAGPLEVRAKPVGEPFLVRAGYRSSVTFLGRSFSMGSYLLHAVHVLPGVGLFGIGGVGVFNIQRDGDDAVSLIRAGEGDALGVPPGAGDLVDGGAYD